MNDRLKFANSIKMVNNEATQIFAQHFFFFSNKYWQLLVMETHAEYSWYYNVGEIKESLRIIANPSL